MDKNEFDNKSLLGNIWQINNVDERLVLSSSQKNDISQEKPKIFKRLKHQLIKIHSSVINEGPNWT